MKLSLSKKNLLPRLRHIFYCLIIFLLNVFAYFPSFYHMPRSDQIVYLYLNAKKFRWVDLAIKTYNFTQSSAYHWDSEFFRPVLYFILGTEKWLFQNNFFLWQVAGVTFHLLVTFALLGLLLRIKKSFFAYLLTAFFSTLVVTLEMVTFQHINAYLIFNFTLLLSLYAIVDIYKDKKPSVWTLVFTTLAMTITCFTAEIGSVFAGLFGCFVLLKLQFLSKDNTQKHSFLYKLGFVLAYWGPPLFYLFMYLGLSGKMQHLMSKNFNWILLSQTIWMMGQTILWWLFAGMLTMSDTIYQHNRTEVWFENPLVLFFVYRQSLQRITLFLFQVSAFVLYAYTFFKTVQWEQLRKNQWLVSLFTLMTSIFTFLILFYRGNESGGLLGIQINSYYCYFFWLYWTLLIYSVVEWNRWEMIPSKPFKRMLIFSMAGLILINTVYLYSMNYQRAHSYRHFRSLSLQINALIDKDPDFSFKVAQPEKHNPILEWIHLKGEKNNFRYFELLYPQYYSEEAPKYILKPLE